jgi:hypothetical protein
MQKQAVVLHVLQFMMGLCIKVKQGVFCNVRGGAAVAE